MAYHNSIAKGGGAGGFLHVKRTQGAQLDEHPRLKTFPCFHSHSKQCKLSMAPCQGTATDGHSFLTTIPTLKAEGDAK